MSAHSGEFSEATHDIPQDWASLAHYLARRGIVFGPSPPRQFAGGYGNLNYLIEMDGQSAVLRRPPPGPLPYGGNDMAREYRILSSLWREYPLAPRAVFFCEEASVLGAPFQIIEYRPGMVVRDTLPPGLAGRPEVGMLLSRHLVESLAALHAVDPARVGLETLGRPAGFLARTVDGWAARSAVVADLINPRALSELVEWLRRRVPADMPPCLVHSDFKLDNMILAPETLAPVAVIDWDMGTRGDPLWDLAVMLSYWVEPEDPPSLHRVRQMPTAQPGFWRRHEVLAAYLRLSSRAVADFTFYRALSLFRSAVVFLQLYDRFRRSPGQNMRCAEFDTLGRELIDHASEIIRGHAE
ncbi:MAG TPA: phosphotransferase family protein [Stellaceae bacterium]|jgi:aminoglycoside phosphotransferase (APT) family kinase protein|nr:phosphotransferase family protein [Stellaceae bacterium]